MRVSELAVRTGVTVRALRYYESVGLIVPRRLSNGYRDYDQLSVQLVEQICALTRLGLTVQQTRPFVECLTDGNEIGDVCPAALATYRHAIVDLQDRINQLTAQRDALSTQLETVAARIMISDIGQHSTAEAVDPATLIGDPMPNLDLAATDGSRVNLGELGSGRTVVFVYPLTGRPDVDLPEGWAQIPGARGCTKEACGFRDRYADLRQAGAVRVYGLSAQSRGYQRELVHRLQLPYTLLADPHLALAAKLGLPTFTAGGMTLYKRLTLVVTDRLVEHVFHPIDDPATHAAQVASWLANHPAARPN
jgi:peroxiredoxin/DNA-binding transcriptional MerR regulator